MSKQQIRSFLKEFCTEVYDMPIHQLELIMDDHKCIKWYGKEYFIPETNLFGNDEKIYTHLVENFSL